MIVTAQKPVSPNHDPLHTIMQLDIPLDTPAARRAMYSGLLEAKKQAMQRAAILAKVGTPLLIAVIAVSFVHVWESIGVYRPSWVPALQLPEQIYHATGAFFTLGIDAAAYYCVAAANVAQLAGARVRHRLGVWFFLALTFLLNAAFIVRYAPDMPATIQAYGLPALDLIFVFMLPAFIPVAIVAIEKAAHLAEASRLKLLVETTALAELTVPSGKVAQRGNVAIIPSQSNNGNVATEDESAATVPSGNKPRYLVADILATMTAGQVYSRAELQQHLGCGNSTFTKIINDAIEQGMVARVGTGSYQLAEQTIVDLNPSVAV